MNKQSKYLDKVIEFLVRDTIIDYEEEKIYFPFCPPYLYISPFPFIDSPPYFVEYCKDTYGLTDPETDYVWEQYKNIMLNKIDEQ